jgi:hypothetical protein
VNIGGRAADVIRGGNPRMGSRTQARSEFVDVLRLPQEEVDRILATLAQRESDHGDDEMRSEPRLTHTGSPTILVQITYPNEVVGSYRAVSRNISSRGLGFLHGKFVYPGSACRIVVRTTDGTLVGLCGSVVRCRHVEGRVHEVGLLFEAPVDLQRFVLDAGEGPAPAEPPSAEVSTDRAASGSEG